LSLPARWLLAAVLGISAPPTPVRLPAPTPANLPPPTPANLPPPTPARDASPESSEREREAAVASILRRAERVTPGAPEAKRLSAELVDAGAGYLRRGESGRAIELLGEAYALDETNVSALAELTLAYAKAEDLDAAAFHLLLVEDRADAGAAAAPTPDRFASSSTYTSIGEIFYAEHRLEEAVGAWSEAARLGGQDPALLRRLALSRDELAVARGQRSLSSEHFALFAEPAVPDSVVRLAAEELEAAYRSQAAFFGSGLAKRQVVVLYGGRAFFALASVPDWVSGVYDGKIRVAVRANAEDPNVMSSVLGHELAHALMRQVSGDRAPGWLHEGLAQWLEGRRISRDETREAVKARGARSIEELESRFPGAMDRAQARALYAQSLSLVEYIVAVRGEGALACIVRRLRDGDTLAEALRREAGLAPGELFSGWRAWAGV
jgi:tetratricopeptide (TPR) repeat protein